MNADRLVRIDGSSGEGGGQILRTALALSAVTGCPVEVVNVRAGRRKPGLAPQHLAGVRAVASVCGGQLEGDELGSRQIRLLPGRIRAGNYCFDVAAEVPSAGSVTLLAQSLLPVLLFAEGPSNLALEGGTHVSWSPPFHYLQGVLVPALAAMGAQLQAHLERWGWYPMGGGAVRLVIESAPALQPVDWRERASLVAIRCVSAVGNLPRRIAERQAEAARARLAESSLRAPVDVDLVEVGGRGRGTMCYLEASYGNAPPAGGCALGRPRLPAEVVGREAADALVAHHASGAAVDLHLADQILPFLALAPGSSSFTAPKVTGHLRTNASVCEAMLGTAIEIRPGEPVLVTVHPPSSR